jgi:hypothetical protein
MKGRGWIAAGIVLVSNLAALGGVAWNRGGEPEAVLELTERELSLPPPAAENTAMALRLQLWNVLRRPSPPEQSWFDRAKLEAIGFDCSRPLDEANLPRYRATPPRRTYAVLEYSGQAWEGGRQSLAGGADDGSSRLMVVDAGNDRAALRARWPDRHRAVIVPAVAVLWVEQKPDGTKVLRGRIPFVQPMELNVPHAHRAVLAPLQARAVAAGPRYRVKVVWGRRDPWIEEVSLLGNER